VSDIPNGFTVGSCPRAQVTAKNSANIVIALHFFILASLEGIY
jgi:hypothetical protein